MRKLLFMLIAFFMVASDGYAASTKLSDLTELDEAPASTDEMYINDGGTSKKITVSNLMASDKYKLSDDAFADLAAAATILNALGTDVLLKIDEAVTMDESVSFDAEVTILPTPGNVIDRVTYNLAINSLAPTAPFYWIDDTDTGTLTLPEETVACAEWFNVDGTADNVQIQSGLDACGKVKLLSGVTYDIADAITGVDNGFLLADDWTTILDLQADGKAVLINDCTNFETGGYKIDGQSAARASSLCLEVTGDSDDIRIHDIWLHDGDVHAFRVRPGENSTCEFIYIDRMKIETGCSSAAFTINNNSTVGGGIIQHIYVDGLEISNVDATGVSNNANRLDATSDTNRLRDVHYVNVQADNTTSFGFACSSNAEAVYLDDFYFDTNGDDAIHLETLDGFGISNGKIVDSVGQGIVLDDTAASHVRFSARNGTIANVEVDTAGSNAIQLSGTSSYPVKDVSVIYNNIHDSVTNGIALYYAEDIIISNNQCKDNGGAGGTKSGITLPHSSSLIDNVIIEGNQCSGADQDYGIYIGNNTAVTDILLRNNHCWDNNDTDISLVSPTGAYCSGNIGLDETITFAFTTEADITDPLTMQTILLDGDNDSDNDTIDLQDGEYAGQIVHLIAYADIDSDDTVTVAMTDTTCANCPDIVFNTLGQSSSLRWDGVSWNTYAGMILAEQITDQNAGTDVTADLEEETHASEHIDGGDDAIDGDKVEITWTPSNSTPATTPAQADSVDDLTAHLYGIDQALADVARLTEGETMQSFGDADATPDVTNGGTSVARFWQTANTGATTITDFDDTDDHSEFTAGDWFILRVDDADTTIDFSSNANIEGNANVDFTGSASQITLLLFTWDGTRWICESLNVGMSDPTTLAIGSLVLPFDESADGTLATDGQVHIRGDEDRISYDMGAGGEVAGEVTKSVLDMVTITFDPAYMYDQESTNRTVPLFTVEADLYPNGIIIDEWNISYNKDPTTELDADLKRADAQIGLANAAVMDVIDTTSGVASEDTDANINAGAAVAAGQFVYIGFGADPTDSNVICTFSLIFHAEED